MTPPSLGHLFTQIVQTPSGAKTNNVDAGAAAARPTSREPWGGGGRSPISNLQGSEPVHRWRWSCQHGGIWMVLHIGTLSLTWDFSQFQSTAPLVIEGDARTCTPSAARGGTGVAAPLLVDLIGGESLQEQKCCSYSRYGCTRWEDASTRDTIFVFNFNKFVVVFVFLWIVVSLRNCSASLWWLWLSFWYF